MSVKIGDKLFRAEYMTTPQEKSKGMMGRNKLDGCMVFVMGKGYHSFWMKGCLINLDIIFILNGIINKIHLNCEAPDRHTMNPIKYNGIGDHVIEFPSGTANNWKVGDKVSLYLGTPQNPI